MYAAQANLQVQSDSSLLHPEGHNVTTRPQSTSQKSLPVLVLPAMRLGYVTRLGKHIWPAQRHAWQQESYFEKAQDASLSLSRELLPIAKAAIMLFMMHILDAHTKHEYAAALT